ncbi:MAG: MYG1 family protein [Verrucomicrobiae bacterium]|jgi:hypothetical protein|nr:MYG1 family protein [Verrucomicrobiae bacterium]
MGMKYILTHPGGAHKDDFLACSLLVARHPVAIVRRDPVESELEDDEIAVIDIGGRHEPAKLNFDHHQFPRDHEPTCSLSLVLQSFGIYEDARSFCDWLEPAEWFDARGPGDTAKWLGVERRVINQLVSPMDVTLLRRFALEVEHKPGDLIWEMMRLIGEDLLAFIQSLRDRLDFIGKHSERWTVEGPHGCFEALFLNRTEPLPLEPSMGIERYVESIGLDSEMVALVYPDRRGEGYGLSRYRDHQGVNFSRINSEADVHFAHARGFVAKSSATEIDRLRELLKLAQVPG